MFLGYKTKSLEKQTNENISFILGGPMIATKLSAPMESPYHNLAYFHLMIDLYIINFFLVLK